MPHPSSSFVSEVSKTVSTISAQGKGEDNNSFYPDDAELP